MRRILLYGEYDFISRKILGRRNRWGRRHASMGFLRLATLATLRQPVHSIAIVDLTCPDDPDIASWGAQIELWRGRIHVPVTDLGLYRRPELGNYPS